MADSIAVPSIQDLAQLQFLPPGLNAIAGQNIQDAQASNQNILQQQQNNNQSTQLANLFQQANDPTKLAQGQASLQGTQNTNAINQPDVDFANQNGPAILEAKRQAMLKGMDADQLADLQTKALKTLADPNATPQQQADAQHAYQNSSSYLAEKQKGDAQLANTNALVQGRVDVAGIAGNAKITVGSGNNATQLTVQGMKDAENDQKLRAAASGGKQSLQQQFTASSAAMQSATTQEDYDKAKELRDGTANLLLQLNGAAQTTARSPDLNKLGVPTNAPAAVPAGPAFRQPAPAPIQATPSGPVRLGPNDPGPQLSQAALPAINALPEPDRSFALAQLKKQGGPAAPSAADTAAPSNPVPPPGAIAYLKANPSTRDKFDKTFGPGSSKTILGS